MTFARKALPVALLALFAWLAVTAMARMSVTGDEVTHLPSGYTYVATGDFRLNMQHPPLIKMLAGLPLLALDLKPVERVPAWQKKQEWRFGKDFLTNNRVPMARIVFLARLPMVAVALLLGAALYLWARELWGEWPAVFVLFLFALSPNLLAHAPIVHTDVGVTCFTLIAVYLLWKFSRTLRLRWALACGVALGLALLAKYSGVVVVGIIGVLLLRMLGSSDSSQPIPLSSDAGDFLSGVGSPLWERGVRGDFEVDSFGEVPLSPPFSKGEAETSTASSRRSNVWSGRGRRTRIVAAGGLIFATAALLVAVGFGFPHGLANYYRGFTMIHADANPHWEAFLWGHYSKDGFWYYYLLAELWKTPLPTLLCFAVALFLAPLPERTTRLDWWFLLLPIVAFHAAGMWKPASIGVRHVLPVFPFVFLCCGATAWWVGRQGMRHKAALALLCLWYAVGTLRAYPHFIPYFNELAGGPAGGVDYLDDSNIDWGQSYYDLKRYLDEAKPAQARFLAFEPIDRSEYGIEAESMHLEDAVWPEPGVTYLVGASYLQRNSLFNDYPGIRLRWVERYRPVDEIGWSIYVYRFSIDPADANDPSVFYVPAEQWYDDATSSLRGILARYPSFEYPRKILARVTSSRAAWRETRGETEAALNDYVEAVALDPAAPQFRAALRAALERLAVTLPVDGEPASIDFRAASVACQRGDQGSCVSALLRTLRKNERHLPARLNLGAVYMRLGLGALARREWEECLRIQPGYAPALQNLRRAAAARGDAGAPPS